MASIIHKLISLDAFGEAVTVNFKGESSYKTLIGALCTICLNGFILVYTVLALIDVMQYKDPQITQVSRINKSSKV